MGAAWVCAGAVVGMRDASSLASAHAPVADFARHLQYATGAQRFACALTFRRVFDFHERRLTMTSIQQL